MAGHRYTGANLPHDYAPDGAQGPTRAWVERQDGTEVELGLRRADGPGNWIAAPLPGDPDVIVDNEAGDHLRLDYLLPAQQVVFDRVWSPAGVALVAEVGSSQEDSGTGR